MFGYYFNLALRSLRRNKVLTALMVLAIALGIGASMTTLTVLHLLSGDPLPGTQRQAVLPAARCRIAAAGYAAATSRCDMMTTASTPRPAGARSAAIARR